MNHAKDEINFIYNSANEVIAATYKDKTYYYLKNAVGDVTSAVDENGRMIGLYQYDAWGDETSHFFNTTNTDEYHFMSINPMLYRGYYFDHDSGFYYLQSRYYVAFWGRFLNSDLPEYAQQQKNMYNGINLFAYCCNDPVNNSDSTGFSVVYKTIPLMKKFLKDFLLKGKTITDASKIKRDSTGLQYIDIKYQKSKKNKNKLRLTFGNKKAWDSSIKYAKDRTSKMGNFYWNTFCDAFSECTASGWRNCGGSTGVAIVSLGTVIGNLIYSKTKIGQMSSNYYKVWGEGWS